MKISSVNNSYNNRVQFGSIFRTYFDENSGQSIYHGEISNYSEPFRKDIDNWMDFAKRILSNFGGKKKINVYCLGCSDGSEAYSYAIAFKLAAPPDLDIFPIIAVDSDGDVIELAKSGRINLDAEDIARMNLILGGTQEYFTDMDDQIFVKDKYHETVNDWDSYYPRYNSYKVDENLRKLVDFRVGDLVDTTEKINDDGDTFISGRNVVPYLNPEKRYKYLDLLRTKLKPNSMVAKGEFDDRINLDLQLKMNGFAPSGVKNLYIKKSV